MAADDAMHVDVGGKRRSVFTFTGDMGRLLEMLGNQVISMGPLSRGVDGTQWKLEIGGDGVGTRTLVCQPIASKTMPVDRWGRHMVARPLEDDAYRRVLTEFAMQVRAQELAEQALLEPSAAPEVVQRVRVGSPPADEKPSWWMDQLHQTDELAHLFAGAALEGMGMQRLEAEDDRIAASVSRSRNWTEEAFELQARSHASFGERASSMSMGGRVERIMPHTHSYRGNRADRRWEQREANRAAKQAIRRTKER